MGQVGQAFSNPNTFAAQPSGFSGSEWAARFLGAGAKGLGQGLQNQQGMNQQRRPMGQQAGGLQPSGGGAPQFSAQNLPGSGAGNFTPQDNIPGNSNWGRNPYFYGYGQGA